MQARLENRRIRFVELFRLLDGLKTDRKGTVSRAGIARLHQGIEDRIAIEARQAAPHQTRVPVNQCSDATVADDSEIKTAQVATSSS